MRFSAFVALVMALPVIVACSSSVGPVDGSPAPKVSTTVSSEYQIGPGDNLQIFVYEAPTLSTSVPVRPDGRISMPLVPDIIAAGKTPTQLSKDVAEVLKMYVKDPNVSVIVHSFNGTFDRQIRVIGEATQPMSLPYSDHMTVLDVMIAAKGLTKYAAGNSAVIVRRVGDKQNTIKLRLSDLLRDGDVSQNVEMQPGDTLIIPQTFF